MESEVMRHMERGSSKHGPDMDERLEATTEPIERSLKEPHVEGERQEEPEEADTGSGHRVRGTGSSADTYSLTDRGEEGGASHPKPKDEES
jgi:hypothetical protein